MEDTLREEKHLVQSYKSYGLNPYSNGRYSQRINESSFRHFI